MSDLAPLKRRFMAMIAIVVACAVVAGGAAVGALAFGIDQLVWLFIAALVAGFAAQIWFIASFKRAKEGV